VSRIELKVNGEKIVADLDELMEITDVSRDMDRIAALMSYWGSVWAAAEAEKIAVDSYYRQWRARHGMEIVDADPKLAEWKVRQRLEASDEFEKIKKGISLAAQNVTTSKGIYEALRVKANMLQSKGAMMRAELDSTSMRTPERKPFKKTSEKEADREEKAEALRQLNRKKKKK
jgi:hypothetical protein